MTNKPTCHKNHEKPSCINLILTNYSCSFQNSRQAYQIFIRWSLLLWKEPLGKSKLSPSIATFFTMTLSGSFYKISFHRICKVIVMTIAKSFLFLAKTFLTGLLHENHLLFTNKALSESTMVKTKRSDLLEYKGPSD